MNPTPDSGNASEAAQLIAEIVPSLPTDTAYNLKRLLALDIALPSRALVREARLGLLVELVALRTQPGLPSEPEYEALRLERIPLGEIWPTSRTLREHYGHWLKAVRAAINHVRGYNEAGGRIKVPASHAHGGRHGSYSRQEVLDALWLVHQAIGDWSTEWEYELFVRAYRKAAKEAGNPQPRIPGMKQIRTHFGNYARAVQAAKHWRANT